MRQELFSDIDPDIKLALQTRKKRFTGKRDIREYSKTAFVRVFPLSIVELGAKDFPTLKFVIPHGGGAVPYHWGRYRGLAQQMGRPPLDELLLDNIYFDTCVYHQPGIDLLTKVIPIKNILFASEMVGAVRGIDPETGFNFDDTKRYIDSSATLSDADKQAIFEDNTRRVFSRM